MLEREGGTEERRRTAERKEGGEVERDVIHKGARRTRGVRERDVTHEGRGG